MFVKNYHAKEKLYHFKYGYRKIARVGQKEPSPSFSELQIMHNCLDYSVFLLVKPQQQQHKKVTVFDLIINSEFNLR